MDVITLLTFPKTSRAFSTFQTAVADNGSASPPTKKARLDPASDTASAYRSRQNDHDESRGPRSIRIVGEPINPVSERRFDVTSNQLRACIRILLTTDPQDKLPLTYEGIYTACQSLVDIADRGEDVYQKFKMELDQCVGRLARLLAESEEEHTKWIIPFVGVCAWFEKQVGLLQSLLAHLDQKYVILKNVEHVRQLANEMFTARIFANTEIQKRLNTAVEDWLNYERQNRVVHELRPRFQELINHLYIYGQYVPIMERPYLEFTEAYYIAESQRLYETCGHAREFAKECKRRIQEEEQRSREVLSPASWNFIKEMTEKQLLNGRLKWLAANAVPACMDDKALDELADLYDLFSRTSGQKVLANAFKEYVQSNVKAIVKDEARDDEMVDRLLECKAFAESAISTAFVDVIHNPIVDESHASTSNAPQVPSVKRANKEFSYAMFDAFHHGFKARRKKPAEMIAKYLDKAMRRGQKGASDEEFDRALDAALSLYRFTDDKDVFRTFYRRGLAKRLLLQRSASDDFEKAVLKKLKEQFDPEFETGDDMFKDLALSKDMLIEFHEKLPEDSPAHKLSVTVLQQSVWPFTTSATVDLPVSMQDQLNRFNVFYKNKHQGRKLEWDHNLGTANLKAQFKAGPKDLSVSLYQAVILLLFNDADEIAFADIQTLVRMENAQLRRTLQSLACGKKRVLKKRPAGPDVDDKDVFYYNADFTDPRPRVHINSIQVKETPEEAKRTQSAIEGDRKHILDAAIVRIMKAKKQLRYEQLKNDTIDAVKKHFVPEVSSIKQRIQSLLEQEYVRRDDDDMNLYIYVA
ncbi:Cullin-4B [Neolentinus lepideus HHB14362 ss-1]|uniref:Cullin-4B n=1 Tax=Neolentinus lepideus HHB14362 ss-1 TaxID=1314782 RepID=A0A165RX19_9AGAM|nr:Cullin-4B [Neolentinus lepideus HHB14362 ss-1]